MTTLCPFNRLARSARASLFILVVAAGADALSAQQAHDVSRDAVAPIEQLFTAMGVGDTAAARRTFAPFARVLPVRGGLSTPLTVDQFIGFVATIPAGSWKERMLEPKVESYQSLAQVWFDYDVTRGDSITQCGRQSVQLVRDGEAWRIASMSFASAATCTARGKPAR